MLTEKNQVSNSDSLESILKKVEYSWKTLDFILLPYKNTKDVFILGSTDDIQNNLNDCKINIEMISNSKYVDFIKVIYLY